MRVEFEQFSEVKIVECADFLSHLPMFVSTGNVLLVTSQGFTKRGVVKQILDSCGASRVFVFDDVTPNPEKNHLQTAIVQFKNIQIAHVIGLGGGSTIDAAKVFCALLSHPDASLDDLLVASEVKNSINLIAIPTTSGTGAEVTPFATVWQSDVGKKRSLFGIKPNVALLDYSLTLSLSPEQTLFPALDALSHAIESLWNKNRTPASESFALRAVGFICESLPQVLTDPNDSEARRDLQHAATLAGMAIAITRTAIAHALSYPLTAKYGVPHGLACSFTLLGIIDVLGFKKLNLPQTLASDITTLLGQLDLGRKLQKYVTWSQVHELSNVPMDPSRAGNFIVTINSLLIQKILLKSEQLTKQADLS